MRARWLSFFVVWWLACRPMMPALAGKPVRRLSPGAARDRGCNHAINSADLSLMPVSKVASFRPCDAATAQR